MGLSFSDHDNAQLKELDWMYGKLIKTKQDEKDKGNAIIK